MEETNCAMVYRLAGIGDQCDIAIYSPVSDKSQIGEPIVPVNHGGLIAGLIVSILLIVIVIGALVYYRRRISHLKSELAHVQYIADPSSAPGNRTFFFFSLYNFLSFCMSALLFLLCPSLLFSPVSIFRTRSTNEKICRPAQTLKRSGKKWHCPTKKFLSIPLRSLTLSSCYQ